MYKLIKLESFLLKSPYKRVILAYFLVGEGGVVKTMFGVYFCF